MKLLVAIVSYRVTDLTIDCLRSLKGEIVRIPGARAVVCENGTGGDAPDQFRRAIDDNGWHTWCDLVVLYPNRGFTGGNNAVIHPALQSDDPPEYVLLLNADTVVEPHALDTLVDFMDAHPKVGIAGSKTFLPDFSVESCPFRFPGIATELDRGLKLGVVSKLLSPWGALMPRSTVPCRAGWVDAASMIVRRTLFEQIGLLDEGLFTYFDDPDLCLRAARAGWEIWHVPDSRVIHFAGQSTKVTDRQSNLRVPTYWHQARRRYFLKHHGAFYTSLADAAFIVGFAAWRLRRRIQRKPDTDPPHMLADAIRQSVFCTGFQLRAVENPALRETVSPAAH